MIPIGMGISLVPLECARQELDACVITGVPVQVQLPSSSVVMVYPVDQVEPALGALIDVMRELAATLKRRTPGTHIKPAGWGRWDA
jgi:DNA-binding transcriptional LysR family regulator